MAQTPAKGTSASKNNVPAVKKLKECNPEDAFGHILDSDPCDTDDLIAAFTCQAMDEFPRKISRSIGFDEEYAGNDHRDEKQDEAPPETAQRPNNCHAQFSTGGSLYVVITDTRLWEASNIFPKRVFPIRGHPATDGSGGGIPGSGP